LKDQEQHQPDGLKHQLSEDQKEPSTKRQFIEPEISQPVDVLEATTFFQSVESGATN
jgi:hypothetical protein